MEIEETGVPREIYFRLAANAAGAPPQSLVIGQVRLRRGSADNHTLKIKVIMCRV